MSNPYFWLAIEMAAVAMLLAWGGAFSLRDFPDSESYVAASRLPLADMLRGVRTIGYPMLLWILAPLTPNLGAIPFVHMISHFAAVFLFNVGLRRFGVSPWQALAASSGVLCAAMNDSMMSYLATDSLGKSLAITTIGFLFWTTASPRALFPWIGLTLSVAGTYQVRPAFLFLVPLVPVLGLFLYRTQTVCRKQRFAWRSFSVAICAAAIGPYLLFSLVRLIVVGHFGLVSFGGYNLVGIAVELVDRETANSPALRQWQSLALEILRRREELRVVNAVGPAGIDIDLWDENYNTNVWRVAVPAAIQIYGDDPTQINRELVQLSTAAINVHRTTFLTCLAYNFRSGLGRFLRSGWVLQAFGLLAFTLFALRVLLFPCTPDETPSSKYLSYRVVIQTTCLVAMLFSLTKLLLVSLVEPTLPRYVHAATLFLPAVFSLHSSHEFATILRLWRDRP